MYKLTVYIPASHVEQVKAALFAAGAGHYAGYDACCWQAQGIGQFRPSAMAQPFAGSAGTLERIEEWRVEMICPEACAEAVKQALLHAHPYEVPAFDFVKLAEI